jgi:hypothetical protein
LPDTSPEGYCANSLKSAEADSVRARLLMQRARARWSMDAVVSTAIADRTADGSEDGIGDSTGPEADHG